MNPETKLELYSLQDAAKECGERGATFDQELALARVQRMETITGEVLE